MLEFIHFGGQQEVVLSCGCRFKLDIERSVEPFMTETDVGTIEHHACCDEHRKILEELDEQHLLIDLSEEILAAVEDQFRTDDFDCMLKKLLDSPDPIRLERDLDGLLPPSSNNSG